MLRDFTISIYGELLDVLQAAGYSFITYTRYMQGESPSRSVILRHDVDTRRFNALRFAQIESKKKIHGTYYFRNTPRTFDESVIRAIAALGHEIGFMYDTMPKAQGNVDLAYELFCKELHRFRKIVPVATISMRGNPLSSFDNRDIWKKYDYRALGILGEPYFDLDFNKVFYVTDTGRRWDGHKVSIRDKAMSGNSCSNPDFLNRRYHTTSDIIAAIKADTFPHKVMMTFHPQRWNNNFISWSAELIMQNLKNRIKSQIVKSSASGR